MPSSIYSRHKGLKVDGHIHSPVLEAKHFHKSPAFKFAVKRAMSHGLTEKQAKAIMKPTEEHKG